MIRTLVLAVVAVGLCGVLLTQFAPKALAQIRAALVKNVDEPGRMPYQHEVDFGFNFNGCSTRLCLVAFPAVPAGKRLVVEHVSALVDITNGGQPTLFAFSDSGATNTGNVAIIQPDFKIGAVFGADTFWSIDRNVLVYYEAGVAPSLKLLVNNDLGPLISNFTLHGYLIDATN
jgi:hypothetical protein